MRKVVSILIVVTVVCWFARALDFGSLLEAPPQPAEPQSDEKMVDLAADVVFPHELGDDSTVICFVGNFIGHHNGAVITCDSAVRYNDQRLECFGNVLINKNTTYVYGDRAEYNGQKNEAQVYSPLIKVVDGDATLYTYKFKFDTKRNIGEFDDGGVITNRESMLESDRGYYYADLREFIGVESVEMRNETYDMKGDSVIYNIDTDRARFFSNTNIWNDKGEYLYADRGSYESDDERYVITLNGYILTENHEVWSDSLDYWRERGYALLRSDIQIDDREHKVLAFGDWGEYWEEPGDAVLTRMPSVVGYDPEQGDTLFMRADTIIMRTRTTDGDREEARLEAEAAKRAEEERAAAEAAARESTAKEQTADKPQNEAPKEETDESAGEQSEVSNPELDPEPNHKRPARPDNRERDRGDKTPAAAPASKAAEGDAARPTEERPAAAPDAQTASAPAPKPASEGGEGDTGDDNTPAGKTLRPEGADSLSSAGDTAVIADEEEEEREIPLEELDKEARRARLRELAEQEREAKRQAAAVVKREKEAARKVLLDSIAERRRVRNNMLLDKQRARDSVAAAKLKAREEARKQKHLERLTRKGIKLKFPDAATMARLDSLLEADTRYYDSLANHILDSIIAMWSVDSLPSTAEVEAADTVATDTLYRLVRGFRNVRVYRSDFQVVCDSMSSSSLDSVIRLYIEPVMWHEANQITSESMDIHTKNQQLDFAEFIEKPLMISKLDTLHFNQVAGKTMFSYFRENEIYRDDVNGSAQTIYYMQDDETQDIQGLMYITSGDMTFYIEDKQVVGITYRTNPDYVLYPMNMIPESQSLFLEGFTWQENRRPSRDSVFTRTIRPSVRAEKEELPRPTFPIAERIDKYRMRLVEGGRWYDRTDVLESDVIDWLDRNTDWREQNARDEAMRRDRRRTRSSDEHGGSATPPAAATLTSPSELSDERKAAPSAKSDTVRL